MSSLNTLFEFTRFVLHTVLAIDVPITAQRRRWGDDASVRLVLTSFRPSCFDDLNDVAPALPDNDGMYSCFGARHLGCYPLS